VSEYQVLQAVFYIACENYVAYQRNQHGRNVPILRYEHHPRHSKYFVSHEPSLTAKLGTLGSKLSGLAKAITVLFILFHFLLRLQGLLVSEAATIQVGESSAPVCCSGTYSASKPHVTLALIFTIRIANEVLDLRGGMQPSHRPLTSTIRALFRIRLLLLRALSRRTRLLSTRALFRTEADGSNLARIQGLLYGGHTVAD
jgi:hypothetical protein